MGISDIWKFDLSEGCPLDIEVTAFSAYTGSWKARTGTQVFYLIIQVLPYPNLSLIHYAAWFGESGRWYAGIRGGPRFASYGGSRGGVGGYLEGGGYVSLAQTPPRSWVSRDELSTSDFVRISRQIPEKSDVCRFSINFAKTN